MPYKKYFSAVGLFFCALSCFAQESLEKKDKLTDQVTEIYHVSPAEPQTKNGLYQAFYHRRTLIAEGYYNKGARAGVWRFFGTRGTPLQTYNFNNDSLVFESREKPGGDFHYLIDEDITDSDRITKPIRIGGRCYGFLPYLDAFKSPVATYGDAADLYVAVVELLISPLGRLAEYKVHLMSDVLEYDQTFTMSLDLFREDDKKFIPATFNYKPILSRVIIKCRVLDNGGLDFF